MCPPPFFAKGGHPSSPSASPPHPVPYSKPYSNTAKKAAVSMLVMCAYFKTQYRRGARGCAPKRRLSGISRVPRCHFAKGREGKSDSQREKLPVECPTVSDCSFYNSLLANRVASTDHP